MIRSPPLNPKEDPGKSLKRVERVYWFGVGAVQASGCLGVFVFEGLDLGFWMEDFRLWASGPASKRSSFQFLSTSGDFPKLGVPF